MLITLVPWTTRPTFLATLHLDGHGRGSGVCGPGWAVTGGEPPGLLVPLRGLWMSLQAGVSVPVAGSCRDSQGLCWGRVNSPKPVVWPHPCFPGNLLKFF